MACCQIRTHEALFQIRLLLRIGIDTEFQIDSLPDLFIRQDAGHEIPDQRLIIILMRAVQQESVVVLPAADASGFPGQFSDAVADGPQNIIAEVPAILLDRGMKVIHIAGHGIQHRVFVDIVKPPDIAEEVVPVQKAGQFIPFRVANQLAVFGQFNAFGDAGFDDLDIRKRFRDKIHRR